MQKKPASKPVWKKPAPKSAKATLSDEDKQAARTRAAKAGRRYPNLIDNMWAAEQAKKRT